MDEREILHESPGGQTHNWAGALPANLTSDLLVPRTAPRPLSQTSQGSSVIFFNDIGHLYFPLCFGLSMCVFSFCHQEKAEIRLKHPFRMQC